MDKRYGILIVSVTILVLCFVGNASATNWSVDGSGGADFTGIQDAINNAKDGDTIIVHSGVYYENVVVNKSVTLKGIGHPVVDANGSGSTITLNADGITLVGFNATNSGSPWGGAGIMVISSDNIITGNNASNNNHDGIGLYSSNNNTITGNNVSNNNEEGIRLSSSSNNNTITGNKVSNNRNSICLYYSSNNNTITGNNVCNNGDGIYLHDSCNNNKITGNNVCNNYHGIYLRDSSNNNTITGNTVNNNRRGGIYLYYSSNNSIIGNTFVNDGLYLSSSYQNIVEDNTVNGKPLVYLEDVSDYKVEYAGQVILVNCDNITVENLDLSNTSGGIALWKTENSRISNNTVCNNDDEGIRLYYSSNNNKITGNNVCNNNDEGICLHYSSNNNKITGNNVCSNGDGIYLYDSCNNSITGNNVSNNDDDGINLYDSCNNNTITGNNVSNNRGGIRLSSSSNNSITGNTFVNDGLYLSSSYQNIVEDNTVNGKPLVYLEDVSDYKVEYAGQVILVNCDNITVENLDLPDTDVGVGLLKTRNSRISNNTLCNNWHGIQLGDSSNNNIITGNNVSSNGFGIDLYSSSNNNTITGNNASNNNRGGISLRFFSNNNKITGNNVCNNDEEGILLSGSSNNNKITGNNVCNNRYGIFLRYSSKNNCITGNNVNNNDGCIHLREASNNKIYFNNFINNNNNVIYHYASTINIWNSPFELTYTYNGNTYTNYVGNYWGDYEQTNPDAEEIVTTGIWNTPYGIAGNKDNYPLMERFENYIISTSAHTELPTPGFELLFAIIGVVAVVYFVRRRG